MKENNRKKILFVIPTYQIGGVTTSLYAFLTQIDRERFDVSLFCRNQEGPFKESFENICNVLPENIWLSVFIRHGGWVKKISCQLLRFFRGVLCKMGVNLFPAYGRIGGKQLGTQNYDCVVSFHEDLSPIVCYYPAKKRIAWIHCDYRRQQAAIGKSELKEYGLYDKIVCVSDFVKNIFAEIYPSLADRVCALHNVVDIDSIKQRAQEDISKDTSYDTSCFTIVSVGRLHPVKQFEKIPAIAAEVKKITDKPFKWYIIGGSRGFDDAEKKMKNDISQLGLQNQVVLLGEKKNIYPYLSKANLFVCTSWSESFPMVVLESRALNVPIVSNDFPSVYETMVDGKEGRIVPIEGMPEVIAQMVNHPFAINSNGLDQKEILESFNNILTE